MSRLERIWPNITAAVPQCYRAAFYDNSTDDGPVEVAAFRFGLADYPARWPAWAAEALRQAPQRRTT